MEDILSPNGENLLTFQMKPCLQIFLRPQDQRTFTMPHSNIDKAGITLHYVEVVRLRAVQRSQSWTIIFIQHMIHQAQESEKEKVEKKQKT